MKRSTVNYIIDMGMAVFFILAALTGILKCQEIPRFPVRFDIYLLTYAITAIHKWSGLLLAVSALAHLILHWRWLVRTTKSIWENKSGKSKGI